MKFPDLRIGWRLGLGFAAILLTRSAMLVGEVRDGADPLSTSNNDLSQRTEMQAGASSPNQQAARLVSVFKLA